MHLKGRSYSAIKLLLLAAVTLTSGQLRAVPPPPPTANPPVTFTSELSPWRFSVGTVVRSIDADFHLSPPDALDWRGLVRQQQGRGDVGLFHGGSSPKVYDDGIVGPELVFDLESTGLAPVENVHSPSQVRSTGRLDRTVFPISTFDFHTQSYSYSSAFSSWSRNVSDSDMGVGPYLELSYRVADSAALVLDVFAGWSFVETNHSTGNQLLARQTVTEHRVLHTYSYEGVTLENSGLRQAGGVQGFPNATGIAVLDPSLFSNLANATNYNPPRQSDHATNRVIAEFYAITSGNLDVDLHEMPLGVKVGRRFGRVVLFAELGGTIDVIDYDLSAQNTWYRVGGPAVGTQRWNDSGTSVKLGAFFGLAVQVDLTQNGRFFLEGHSTYRWVDSAHAQAGPVSTKIDVSSWEGGVSLGIRL